MKTAWTRRPAALIAITAMTIGLVSQSGTCIIAILYKRYPDGLSERVNRPLHFGPNGTTSIALPGSLEVLAQFSHALATVDDHLTYFNKRKNLKMKLFHLLFVAVTLVVLPACEQNSNVNQQNGVKDAIGARPYEDVRDATEDASDAVKQAGQDFEDAVNGS